MTTDVSVPPDTAPPIKRGSRLWVYAVFGLLAAGAAVGSAQLVAAFIAPTAAPAYAVGGAFIDRTPLWLKEFAIARFGTNDKEVLLATIAGVLVVVALVCGVLSRRFLPIACVGVAAIGLIGAAAALTRPFARLVDALPSLVGSVVGVLVLVWLTREAQRRTLSTATPPSGSPGKQELAAGTSRRTILVSALSIAAYAAVAGVVGTAVSTARSSVAGARAAIRLPKPADPAKPVPAGAAIGVPGTVAFTTANSDFYRVDINLSVPQVNPTTYQLTIDGMVEHSMKLSFDDLLSMRLVERDITMTCVSNEVGGRYVGNARWLGVHVKDLLATAGVKPGADQILTTAVDGFTVSTPLAVVTDGRDAMLAVGMNGQPLPLEHGFPVRMIVPGLYGYVSGTKWLTQMTVTTFAAQQAYWTQRGYAEHAPIRTMTRIEVPAPLATIAPGKVAIAGTAWAQHRGIEGVEVQVDNGPWLPAGLAAQDTIDTWRQWSIAWQATSGQHTLRARSVDGTGQTQTSQRREPVPSGASGWHEIVVLVS
jgi:DMSO/TMAO reductase YedYZ molybdopterin-dependent catalytic subunit